MAGGNGGAGGSPGGATGATGATQPQNTYGATSGGAGGDNGVTITVASQVYGPFGQGGAGADVFAQTGADGNPGAVIIGILLTYRQLKELKILEYEFKYVQDLKRFFIKFVINIHMHYLILAFLFKIF